MTTKTETETQRPLDYEKHVPEDNIVSSVTIKATAETEHGAKAVIESDYEAKDDIKDLDWDETHRDWCGSHEMSGDVTSGAWLVDLEAVEDVVDHLVERGHQVSLNKAVFDYDGGDEDGEGSEDDDPTPDRW